jgi:membrane-bound lytic murein transglycosylase B
LYPLVTFVVLTCGYDGVRRSQLNGEVPSTRRRFRRITPARRAVAIATALCLPLIASSSHAATGAGVPVAAPSPPASKVQAPVITPIDLIPLTRNLHAFDKAARKPAASPRLHRLPKVHLLDITPSGIPPVAAAAYVAAAHQLASSNPSCGVHWWLVAGIGYVESGHAASGGSHRAGWNGIANPPILGPVLDGSNGYAAIRDTDGGRYDGNTQWDRAVGPMQFLPSTWRTWGAQPGGGLGNPQDIRAAALATARYLCASGGDLSQARGMALAVFSYNHSFDYVRLVLSVAARYAGLNPASLGVNTLPTDKQYRHHRKREQRQKARHHKAKSTAKATPKPTSTTATSTQTGGSQPSPSPSPTTSSGGGGGGGGGVLPSPSPSQTILPLPTGGLP